MTELANTDSKYNATPYKKETDKIIFTKKVKDVK